MEKDSLSFSFLGSYRERLICKQKMKKKKCEHRNIRSIHVFHTLNVIIV